MPTTAKEKQRLVKKWPSHGSVFNMPETDDYNCVYLGFSWRSINRQTYVKKLEFNKDSINAWPLRKKEQKFHLLQ